MTTWEDLKLSPETLELVKKAGYSAPTPVQAESIPFSLAGEDVIASAQTGSGKTASFVLPMVERFAGRQGTYGLVLAPTRELAQQTQAAFEIFGAPRGVRSIVLIGGVDMRYDEQAIQTYPQVIVATPGRLCDHLDRGNIWLDFIQMVVLDEADRMLDMGFTDQLNRIMQDVPSTRQTLLFSATFTAPVEKLARKSMHPNPKRIAIGKPQGTATTVEQRFLSVKEEGKNRELRKLISEETGSIIVFTRSKIGATQVWRSLHSNGVYDATYIHSDRLQSHREQALAEFKEGKYRILIATDVAARGIHVEGVAHVVNFDLPLEPEDYVHRIGRTGRAGASGKATTFVTPRDRGLIRQIERMLGQSLMTEAEAAPAQDRSENAQESQGRSQQARGNPGGAPRSPQGEGEKRRRRRGRGKGPKPQGQPGQGAQSSSAPISADPTQARPQSQSPSPAQGSAEASSPRSEGPDSPDKGGGQRRRRRGRGGRGGGGGNGDRPKPPSGSEGGGGTAFPV